jgi:hypothetical protein
VDYHIQFIPSDSRADLLRVDLRVERESSFVSDISYIDPSGSTTSYSLEHFEVKAQPEEYFRFNLLEGLRLLDLTSDQN